MPAECAGCGRRLLAAEVGLTRKLLNRAAAEYFCKTCLAARFHVTEAFLDEKILQFRREGCALFPPLEDS